MKAGSLSKSNKIWLTFYDPLRFFKFNGIRHTFRDQILLEILLTQKFRQKTVNFSKSCNQSHYYILNIIEPAKIS